MRKAVNVGLTALASVMLLTSAPAFAQIVDGVGSSGEYSGGSTATVATDPSAPTSNFGTPGPSATAGYTINLRNTDGSLFGLITQTGGESAGAFANLYFDLDSSTRPGSDLGFELGGSGATATATAFAPGRPGSVSIADALFDVTSITSSGLTTLEFRLANSLFTSAIAGVDYDPVLTFGGNTVRLNLSQSLSYSVAGGQDNFGSARLGTFDVGAVAGAVPEPGTWAMMLFGFGAIGTSMRRRKRPNGNILQLA